MSDPKDKSSLNNPPGISDVDAEQDVITNSEEIVNQEGVVADTDGITETFSESEPSTAVNAAHTSSTESQPAGGDTISDADVAGDDNII
ncbi:hypothetical protein A0256_08055 [Mucilaginibacter sp. PAMC 26640]|nr:hypothetical protein A0256_08055 [Mucilaginibacter sp. PAMC 26640]